MRAPFTGDDCRNQAIIPAEGKSGTAGSENAANTDSGNRIACTKEDKLMRLDFKEGLSNEDVLYIRNRIAEGIARALVEKVAKSAVPAVDRSEIERYNPSPQKGGF